MGDLLDDLIQSASAVRLSHGGDTAASSSRSSGGSASRKNPFASSNRIISSATPDEKIEYKANLQDVAAVLVFDGKEELDSWTGFSPSGCRVEDGIGGVRVDREPGAQKFKMEPVNEEMLEELDREFKDLADAEVTTDKIRDLATKYDLVSGKWLVWCRWVEVDAVWAKLTRALLDGRLDDDVLYLKASARDDRPENVEGADVAKISVVTKDFRDRSVIFRVEKAVRSVGGVKSDMKYKADIYTRLGLFARNKYNIVPTLFRSSGGDKPSTNFGRGRGHAVAWRGRRF